jgi:hypothetical protein
MQGDAKVGPRCDHLAVPDRPGHRVVGPVPLVIAETAWGWSSSSQRAGCASCSTSASAHASANERSIPVAAPWTMVRVGPYREISRPRICSASSGQYQWRSPVTRMRMSSIVAGHSLAHHAQHRRRGAKRVSGRKNRARTLRAEGTPATLLAALRRISALQKPASSRKNGLALGGRKVRLRASGRFSLSNQLTARLAVERRSTETAPCS